MNSKNKTIISVVILIVVIAIGAFAYYKTTKAPTGGESTPASSEGDDALSASGSSGQPGTSQTGTGSGSTSAATGTASSGGTTPVVTGMVFITKAGLQIPYPKEYTFSELPQGNRNTACPDSGVDASGKTCYTILPNMGSELITFKGADQTETVDVITSDTSGYNPNACQSMPGTTAAPVTADGQTMLHSVTATTEEYCLVTPKYTFTLNRNISSSPEIDVSKILFP